MKRSQVVTSGGEQLFAAEDAIDLAFISVTSLAAGLTRLRMDAKLSITVGHEALARVSSAASRLAEARQELVAAHADLSEVRTRLGCGGMQMAGGGDKFNEAIAARGSHLRPVAAA